MTTSPAEVESLKRQVSSLSFQLVRLDREHEQELAAKDKLHSELVLKRDKRYKKTDQLLADARTENADLRRSLNSTTAQMEAKKHQVSSLQQEVATLCGKADAAAVRIKHLEQTLASRPAGPADGRPRRARATSKKPPAGRARLKKVMRAMEHTSPSHTIPQTKAVGTREESTVPSRTPQSADHEPDTHPIALTGSGEGASMCF